MRPVGLTIPTQRGDRRSQEDNTSRHRHVVELKKKKLIGFPDRPHLSPVWLRLQRKTPKNVQRVDSFLLEGQFDISDVVGSSKSFTFSSFFPSYKLEIMS